MAQLEGKTLWERYKPILAVALGAVMLIVLVRGFSSKRPPANPNRNQRPTAVGRTTGTPGNEAATAAALRNDPLVPPQEIVFTRTSADAPEARRNIFAFYVPPAPATKIGPTEVATPEPTPPPPPPLLLAALAPSQVYARTGDVTLQVSGDKFTPPARIYVDGQELSTRFVSAQQLSAAVPTALLAAPGAREVVVRTPDGQLYSNSATLNVTPPPVPPYTYIGLLGGQRYNDTALLKDQRGELVNVQRGDVVGRRFRVTSISERAIEFTDQELKVKHSLPLIEGRSSGSTSGNMRSDPSTRYVPPPQQEPLQQLPPQQPVKEEEEEPEEP